MPPGDLRKGLMIVGDIYTLKSPVEQVDIMNNVVYRSGKSNGI